MELLDQALTELEGLREELNQLPEAHDVREILENPLYAEAYSNGLNAASVIFQNRREGEAGAQDILMTGDAPPEILEGLTEKLYDGYNILKAPHHGTASAYCSLFTDMSFAHILISNGEYHAGGRGGPGLYRPGGLHPALHQSQRLQVVRGLGGLLQPAVLLLRPGEGPGACHQVPGRRPGGRRRGAAPSGWSPPAGSAPACATCPAIDKEGA